MVQATALQILQDAPRFFNVRRPQDDESLFRSGAPCQIRVLDIHLSVGEALGDFGKDARLARRLDREHFGLECEHARFAQEHEGLRGIAHDHAHHRMIDSVGSSQRMNIHSGVTECFTHARKGPGTICKKHCELGCRFDGELGRCIHAAFKVTPGIASDNSGNSGDLIPHSP